MTITLLDGGMGKELLRVGAPFRQPEWSALALMEAPERVVDVHRSFIDAGAQVITTNSYAVVPYHIGHDRFTESGRQLASLAAEMARRAVGESGAAVRVAASIPPVFGSYEPASFDPQRAPELLDVLVTAQAEQADLWIAETVSSIAEAEAAIAAIERVDSERPIWLSVCVPDRPVDGRAPLRSGEPIGELHDRIGDRIDALLVNCSQPEMVDLALVEIAEVVGHHRERVAFGGYANAFEPEPRPGAANTALSDHRADLTPSAYADIVGGWIDRGATIVGGCCGIGPDHVRELAARHS